MIRSRRPWVLALLIAMLVATGCTSSKHAEHPLPLDEPTGTAQQVLTVVAASVHSPTAKLQAWNHTSDGWRKDGAEVLALVGSQGLTRTPHEDIPQTPIGSFTLTQAFGRLANPGTKLPYIQTTPDDWWISQAGALYNTHQRCKNNCAFAKGSPNTQLGAVMPEYGIAVVIDYNRDPVVQGAGSAFFLHVSANKPTNGCVAIDQDDLARIMRWLDPAKHPRILIGTGPSGQ